MIQDKEITEFIQDELNRLFIEYCKLGDLDNIKYMLTSPNLTMRPDFSFPDTEQNDGLMNAAANGHLEIVKYLLFSPDLEKNDSYPSESYDHLKLICERNHFHIADFLLENKLFNPEVVFNEVHNYGADVSPLTYYLVLNCNIPITTKVQKIINNNINIAKVFESRELNKELYNILGNSDNYNRKFKL